MGVIGCGYIGAGFARKVGCLGARVLGYDAAGVPEELVHDGVVEPADLYELLAGADAVFLHAPLTEHTRHLIGAEQTRLMESGAYLVNTSRGGLVDSAALLRALNEGEIAGAALDVLETEPPEAGDPLVHPRAGPDHPARRLVLGEVRENVEVRGGPGGRASALGGTSPFAGKRTDREGSRWLIALAGTVQELALGPHHLLHRDARASEAERPTLEVEAEGTA